MKFSTNKIEKILSRLIDNIKYNPFLKDLEKYNEIFNSEIKNKNVLVIGGAGTIGTSYIKQILKYYPKKLCVVDINENGLTELTRDLRSSNLLDYQPEYITYPVNLLSKTFDKVFFSDDFHIVANFSAHKHVRSEKDIISVEALILNNVFGAIKLLNLCEVRNPNYFFSVSTDKAANPVNIMGASKSLMEKLIISKKDKFRVSTARFANVAFSNGSLLDGFLNRMNKKQPLSCPSDIRRFFVTPEQSGQICLLSTFLGKSGNIFFPKLDFHKDQIYFKDIALEFLSELNYDPKICDTELQAKNFDFDKYSNQYPIYFFKTDTSGEKSYEEFYSNDEDFKLSTYESLGYIATKDCYIDIDKLISEFELLFDDSTTKKEDLVKTIKKYVSSFNHIETGKHLDQKM